MCVCVCERERERERGTGRERGEREKPYLIYCWSRAKDLIGLAWAIRDTAVEKHILCIFFSWKKSEKIQKRITWFFALSRKKMGKFFWFRSRELWITSPFMLLCCVENCIRKKNRIENYWYCFPFNERSTLQPFIAFIQLLDMQNAADLINKLTTTEKMHEWLLRHCWSHRILPYHTRLLIESVFEK